MRTKLNVFLTLMLALVVQLSFAQGKLITGVVTEAGTGEPLPGVNVIIKGTQQGAATDFDGKYTIKAKAGDVLVFSAVGYSTVEKTVGSASKIDVQLKSGAVLDQVVVTAMGISRAKKSLGYAVQKVKGDDLAKAKEVNIVNSLTGKVAGVQITNASGAVGSSARIVIRGNSSFTNNQPLWIVDGVPISNASTPVDQFGAVDYGNAAMDIDPENIESVTVLKGANAAALYGSRAANGVILIKTKTGKGAKKGIGISVSSAVTFDQPSVFANYQNEYGQGSYGSEYYYNATGANLAGIPYQDYATGHYIPGLGFSYYDGNNGGVKDGVDESWGPRLDIGLKIPQFDSPLSDPTDPTTRQATPWVSQPNNVRDFFQTGITTDNAITLTSNSENNSLRLSLSNQNVSGTVPNTDLSKTGVAFNGIQKLGNYVTARISANYVKNKSNNLPTQGYDSRNIMQSIGSWFGRQVNMNSLKEHWKEYNVFGNPYNWNTNYHNNPYWTVGYNTASRNRDRIFGRVAFDFKLFDWATLTTRFGNDYYSEQRKQVDHVRSVDYQEGHFWENFRNANEFNADAIVKLSPKFKGDLSVSGLIGANYRRNNFRYNYLEAPKLTVPDLYTISNVKGNPVTDMYRKALEANSIYGQASLGYKDMVYLDLTARNDWSSTLPKSNWSYFYPSATVSLILTKLFNVKSDVLSFAKLRGGWAKVGNTTDPYKLAFVFKGNNPFGSVTPFYTTRELPNINLKPEEVTSTEVGLELRMFKNRVNLDATYYDAKTRDQILAVDISTASGFDSALINAGEIENKGVELQLSGDIFKKKNGFNWNVAINWAKNKNRVNKLYGDLESYQISSSWNGVTIEARPGKPFGVIRANGFKRDANGNKIIGSNGIPIATDAPIEVGNITPDWVGGIRNTFGYKNMSFSFLIDGRKGGDLFSVTDWFGAYAGTTAETVQNGIREHGLVVDGVKADGTPNDVVVSAQSYYHHYWGLEENSIIDGSYIKLREATFTYKLPKKLLKHVSGIRGIDLSLIGRNLLILYTDPSNDVGIDPETGFGTSLSGLGLEQYQLPTSRTLGFRINLSF